MKIKDRDMRPVLFDYLDLRYGKIRTYEELYIGDTRADILAVIPGMLLGFEIKSDADTYTRLETQVKDYDKYCDLNYVVIGESHAKHISEHIPEHWGIMLVAHTEGENGCGTVTELREAKPNRKVKLNNKLKLLWRRELSDLLKRNSLPKYAQKSKKFVSETLLERVEETLLAEQICDVLFERDYTIFEDDPNARKKPKKHSSAKTRQRRAARRILKGGK